MERLSWQIVVSVLSFMLAGVTVESGWWPLFFGVGIVAGFLELYNGVVKQNRRP